MDINVYFGFRTDEAPKLIDYLEKNQIPYDSGEMVCSVEIDNPATDNMILLPLRCVTQTLNKEHFVWKVSGDSVTRQKVTLGKPVGNSITVIDGVQSGDRIVTKGMEKISEGDKIVW